MAPSLNEIFRLRDERDKQRHDNLAERIDALKDAIQVATEVAVKANDKAAQAYDKRFDNTNEWRDAMDDLQQQFPRKAELDPALKRIEERLIGLETQRATAAATKEGFGLAGTIIATVIGSAAILIPAVVSILGYFKH